ncbi:hypothetical protein ACG7TL_002158 [Trametes sanguinea]
MSSTSASSPAVTTKEFLHSLIIGFAFSAVLYGITVMQSYVYYRRYPKDGISMKLFVGCVAPVRKPILLIPYAFAHCEGSILDTLTTAFAGQGLHTYAVDDYLQPNKVGSLTWSLITENYLSIVLAAIVEFFYAHCLWISLCYYLHANKSGIKQSDMLIDKLMMYAVQRALTRMGVAGRRTVQAFETITIIAVPTSLVFLPVTLMLSKLYTNALLATLNVRDSLKAESTGVGNVITLESRPVFTRGGDPVAERDADSDTTHSRALEHNHPASSATVIDIKGASLVDEAASDKVAAFHA